MKEFHVAIIGGGVIGSAIAQELSKYDINVIVFEKGSDVASEASKANSGVVHSGINSPSGSLKARFCVEGNQMLQALSDELAFSLRWVGKYVIAKNTDEIKELERLKKIGEKNKVAGLEIHDDSIVKKKEPNVSCVAGLWVPTAGIVLPYEFTIALAENAAYNGVHFFLETKVTDLKKQNNLFKIKTNKGVFKANCVINSTGLHCKEIVSMVEKPDFNVFPCRGEYLVLDKYYSNLITSMIYPIPVKELGVLGVHLTPTIEGNILIGPSAEFIEDAEDKQTTKEVMTLLMKEAREIIPTIPKNAVINAFSGIRCKLSSPQDGGWADYRIEESKQNPGMINLLGIESPGLTAAPAIDKEVTHMISKYFELKNKKDFKTFRRKKRFADMTVSRQDALIKKDNHGGRIICRCEQVTEAEVIDALKNPINARSLSSVKNRCRAGMGRCQGGFCTQHIVKIMEKEFNMNIEDMKLKSSNSTLFKARTREDKS